MCTRSEAVKRTPLSGASTHCPPICQRTKYKDRWRRPNGTPGSSATSALRKPLAAMSARAARSVDHRDEHLVGQRLLSPRYECLKAVLVDVLLRGASAHVDDTCEGAERVPQRFVHSRHSTQALEHARRLIPGVSHDPRHERAGTQGDFRDVAPCVCRRVRAQRRRAHHSTPLAPHPPVALVHFSRVDWRALKLRECRRSEQRAQKLAVARAQRQG
eukprot:6213762-Pleurochrysis_carterae.AAC.2